MFERIKRWAMRRSVEKEARKYPRIHKYVYTNLGDEHLQNFQTILEKHGQWIESRFEALEKSERKDVVMKFAQIIKGYVEKNPAQIDSLQTLLPKDEERLARILAHADKSADHREIVGQIVLYSQIPDEARWAEMRKIMDVLNEQEKHRILVALHNHAMLRVPGAAIKAVFDEIVQKRPDLKPTLRRILGEQR